MAFNKCECYDGQTVITAKMMNDIQDAICGLEDSHDGLEGSITGLEEAVARLEEEGTGGLDHMPTPEEIGAHPNTWMPTAEEVGAATPESVSAEVSRAKTALQVTIAARVRESAPRNLLDNSDFSDPVNQRGKASYSGAAQFTIDRWKVTNANTTLEVIDGGIKLSNPVAGSAGYLLQVLPRSETLLGKTVTLALELTDGKVLLCQCTFPIAFPSANTVLSQVYDGETSVGGILLTSYAIWVRIWSNAVEESRSFKWAALYEGAYTAQTLPAYKSKGYGVELVECQRYFQIRSTNDVPAVDMRPTMRLASPTISEVTGGYSYSADL